MFNKFCKRTISSCICLVALISSIGCADQATEKSSPAALATEELSLSSDSEAVDVDLTVLSSTAVYGAVYDMMCHPEEYVGKSIKMEGIYSDYFDQATGKHYYSCVIMDATACCAQGFEFILTNDYKYPDDYPSEGDDIVVEGIFETYLEGDFMYCTLKDASLSAS